MTAQGAEAAAMWLDTDFAKDWATTDSFRDLLDFPRRMAAAVVAGDNPDVATIIDVGAGPGAVLEVFLRQLPRARGIWTDASRAMLDLAHEKLAPFGDRVEYRIVDMTDLDGAGLPDGADVITTSRAAHHLDKDGLVSFYGQAARKLRPGGWLINLDHIGPASQAGPPAAAGFDDVWDKRLRAARKQFGVTPDGPKHHHNYPLTSVADHLDAYAAAGVSDVEVVWRAFYTCLFMGRTPS
ncbi:MAG TPA: class I SAM-dependent methyltransferase [Trebonia sp.]|jgi:SAM-dependent methyltransferase|nr:class I SAM-dependent methyltransferase [Trebonia sp.]